MVRPKLNMYLLNAGNNSIKTNAHVNSKFKNLRLILKKNCVSISKTNHLHQLTSNLSNSIQLEM